MKKQNVNIGLLAPRNEKRVGAETHTCHHRNLIMQWSIAPQELVDLAIDRALAPPLYNRVKQEPVEEASKSRGEKDTTSRQHTRHSHRNDNSLVTPIRILLPSIQFIIHTERYTFFEASLGVSGPAGYQES